MKERYAPLFDPIILPNGVCLANRFVLSPMVTNSSTATGHVTAEDIAYAYRRAASAPLQITGAAYVDDFGQLFEFGFSVTDDATIEGLSQLATAMKASGQKAILQLTHAGRFSTGSLKRYGFTYGPSPMTLNTPFVHEVKEMSVEQLKAISDDYAQATRRAIAAGFDGVEVSSAQRLLIQTFFSTFSNQRQDCYGCQNLPNRSRLGLEVLKSVQEVIDQEATSDFIFGFRGTPEETRGNQIGYTIDEFLQFMDWSLEVARLDYLAIASWGHEVFRNLVRAKGDHHGSLVNEVVFQHFKGRLPIMATGGINTPDKAIEALRHADFVGLSTPFVVDPELVKKIQLGQEETIDFRIRVEDLEDLAIPQASFKDIVPLMDLGRVLPDEVRQLFRELEINYKEKG